MTTTDTAPLDEIARKHGFGVDAAAGALAALRAGHGRQAQFNHPDLGGLGQWSSGGMLMIGDMFNHGLKARVAALFDELSALPPPPIDDAEAAAAPDAPWLSSGAGSWPEELGAPSSTGSQNDMHYAVFPQTRRLAIRQGGKMTIHDTGDHIISGVGQQQSGSQSLRFSSQSGSVDVASLPLVEDATASASPPTPANPQGADRQSDGEDHDAIIRKIESLHGLFEKGIISRSDFDAKKQDLLDRL